MGGEDLKKRVWGFFSNTLSVMKCINVWKNNSKRKAQSKNFITLFDLFFLCFTIFLSLELFFSLCVALTTWSKGKTIL